MTLGRTDSRVRLFSMLLVVMIVATGMAARLAYWQIGQAQSLTQSATQGSIYKETIPAERGTIYDRTGTVVLAQTIYLYRVIGDPHDLTDAQKAETVSGLMDFLALSDQDALKIRTAMAGQSYYVLLATDVSSDVVQEMKTNQSEGGLPGISFEQQPVRVYPQAGGAPNTSLASQLLGFVNAAGKGQYGVEQKYDSVLAGRPKIIQIDPTVPGPDGTTILDPGTPGQDIRTTIDASLQLQVEKEVFATWIADKAKTVSSVVMDPKTGDVLAEASYPAYDANNYAQVADQDPDLFNDPVVTDGLRAGISAQDAHDIGCSPDQDDGSHDHDRRLRHPQAAGRPGSRRRRPQGQGLADVRLDGGLLAQRRPDAGRVPAGQLHGRGFQGSLSDLA
jgi:cell division protein FtsI/penicillin-binding protein 2